MSHFYIFSTFFLIIYFNKQLKVWRDIECAFVTPNDSQNQLINSQSIHFNGLNDNNNNNNNNSNDSNCQNESVIVNNITTDSPENSCINRTNGHSNRQETFQLDPHLHPHQVTPYTSLHQVTYCDLRSTNQQESPGKTSFM